LVGTANVDVTTGATYLSDDGDARFVTAEATLIKVLSMSPQHARGHMLLGFLQTTTNRAAPGILECERALALDRNLAEAHSMIGLAKLCIGRGAETEVHIQEALRLSPRDTGACRWTHILGATKLVLGADAEAVVWLRRCLEAERVNDFGTPGVMRLASKWV
jgi:Flp pilus assembly protein TadD